MKTTRLSINPCYKLLLPNKFRLVRKLRNKYIKLWNTPAPTENLKKLKELELREISMLLDELEVWKFYYDIPTYSKAYPRLLYFTPKRDSVDISNYILINDRVVDLVSEGIFGYGALNLLESKFYEDYTQMFKSPRVKFTSRATKEGVLRIAEIISY